MKKSFISLIVLGLVLLALIFFGYNLSTQKADDITGKAVINKDLDLANVMVFTINASRFKFEPNIIRVKQGDTIRLVVNNIDGLHSIHFHEDEGYDVEGTDVTFVADKAGNFEFHCAIYCGSGHNQMNGTLIVEG